MKDFEFDFTTHIVFGRNAEKEVGNLISEYGRHAIILYGSDRIRKNGLFDSIVRKLECKNVSWIPFGGITENPTLEKVEEGIELVRNQDIDVLLAVGGGSVIDTAKAISLGSYYEGPVWDLFLHKARAGKVLPIGVVLTMSATASEANGVSVIWNKAKNLKCALSDSRIRPVFACMNPELTYSVPIRTTAAGSIDIFSHAFERYLVKEQRGTLRDYLCESIMKTVVAELPLVIQNPFSYEHRSQLMWTATMAHSDMIGLEGDYACHALSHVFTEEFGLSHGEALAILMPAWCRLISRTDPDFTNQFFQKVWDVKPEFESENISETGIRKFCEFISSCHLSVSLTEAGIRGINVERLAQIAVKKKDGYVGGGYKKLYLKDVKSLIELCI